MARLPRARRHSWPAASSSGQQPASSASLGGGSPVPHWFGCAVLGSQRPAFFTSIYCTALHCTHHRPPHHRTTTALRTTAPARTTHYALRTTHLTHRTKRSRLPAPSSLLPHLDLLLTLTFHSPSLPSTSTRPPPAPPAVLLLFSRLFPVVVLAFTCASSLVRCAAFLVRMRCFLSIFISPWRVGLHRIAPASQRPG
jgi:hypothetical protein